MGSGAQSKLADASAADLAGAYGELPSEAKTKLQEALQLLQAPCLACRSASGEIVKLPVTKDSTYKDLAAALREKLPETKTQVIQFFVSTDTSMDEYKTLGDQGFDDAGLASAEFSYTASELSYGEKISQEEATPLLDEATNSVASLPVHAAEIKELINLKTPPQCIRLAMEGVACLLEKPRKSWEDLTKMLDEEDFMTSMQSFLTKEVPLEALVELQWYMKHPDLQKDELERVSRCAASLQSMVNIACSMTLIKKRAAAPAAAAPLERRSLLEA
ncbi:dhc1 [Symbiodinium sp. CCMP2456]|nr:dhc1 [Symbiodinium sp. CCMP2456]